MTCQIRCLASPPPKKEKDFSIDSLCNVSTSAEAISSRVEAFEEYLQCCHGLTDYWSTRLPENKSFVSHNGFDNYFASLSLIFGFAHPCRHVIQLDEVSSCKTVHTLCMPLFALFT